MRIDLACVTPDLVVLAEVKSERDVLDRLPLQVEMANLCGDDLIVCTTPGHAAEIERRSKHHLDEWVETSRGVHTWVKNPDFDKVLAGVTVLKEVDGVLTTGDRWGWTHATEPRRVSTFARLQLLWAAELRQVASDARIGVSGRTTRWDCIALCAELMTGREIRSAVCRALRARSFPRADPVVPLVQITER